MSFSPLLALLIAAGCSGDCEQPLPDGTVCMEQLDVATAQITVNCPQGTAGGDGYCQFLLESRNTSVATLYPPLVNVPEGAEGYPIDIEFRSNQRNGTAVIVLTNEYGDQDVAGTVIVGGC